MKHMALLFRALLVPVDALSLFVAGALSYKLRVQPELFGGLLDFPVGTIIPFAQFVQLILIFIPIFLIIFALEGLYNVTNPRRGLDQFAGVFLGTSTAVAIIIAWLFISKQTLYSRLILGYFWILSIAAVVGVRSLLGWWERYLYRRGVGVRKVIVVGANTVAQNLVKELVSNQGHGLRLIGLVGSGKLALLEGLKGIRFLGPLERFSSILTRYEPDEVIVADPKISPKKTQELLGLAEEEHVVFRSVPNLFEMRASNVAGTTLGRMPVLTYKRTPLEGWGRIYKRLFDITVALAGILALAPVLVLVALLVKITSSGPVMIVQKRLSGKKSFQFLKFRSMYQGAQQEHTRLMAEHGVMFKLKADPRVTPLGAFLRRTSLDELPQLWNVLKGEMSIVGPRPPMVEEVKHYTPWQRKRLLIKPGITGLWQVSGRSDISFDEWVRLDLAYIENWSAWLDVQIILKTIWIVVTQRGAY